MNKYIKTFFLIVGFALLVFAGTGCATPEKSDFLSGSEQMHQGKYLHSFWSDEKMSKQVLSKIYIEPIDVSRIKNYPDISTLVASNDLRQSIIWNLSAATSWTVVEKPELATAKISLAITYLTPGSVTGRILAAELGAGHAVVQVDGKLIDGNTSKIIACFEDRRRDSGVIGFEDLGGDASPLLIRHMLDSISANLIKELSAATE